MPDTPIYLITNAGPDHDETEAYSTEALARAAFAEELECQNDDACGGFDPGQPTPMLLRAEVLLSSEFVTFATAEEDSEDGARCRANGWDYLAKLTAFGPDPPAADPALLAAANRELLEEVERLRKQYSVQPDVAAIVARTGAPADVGGGPAAGDVYDLASALTAARAEVERLRSDLASARAEVTCLIAERDAALAEQADDDAEWEAIQAMPREVLCSALRAEGIDPESAYSHLQATAAQVHRIVEERDSARALARTLLLCARSGDVLPRDLPEWMEVARG